MKPKAVNIQKRCGCETVLTNENIHVIGTSSLGMWFNCPKCKTTRLEPMDLCSNSKIQVGNNVFTGFFSVNKVFQKCAPSVPQVAGK